MSRTTRSYTGNHNLLPSSRPPSLLPDQAVLNGFPKKSFLKWTLSRGVIIWRIWPAVLLHTVVAAAVVTISLRTNYNLGIPNVLITVLGVVIGFVISYRASSGYDRYWAGRTCWSDVFRNSRTFSRLIWFHVPPRITTSSDNTINPEEAHRVMREKNMALDLVEGFVVALKHHLRGELGIFYEDLYPLVKPLHNHLHHNQHHLNSPLLRGLASADTHPASPTNATEPYVQNPIAPPLPLPAQKPDQNLSVTFSSIPPINSYGSFRAEPHIHSSIAGEAHLGHHASRKSQRTGSSNGTSRSSSKSSERELLLPSRENQRPSLSGRIRSDLVPFGGTFKTVFSWMVVGGKKSTEDLESAPQRAVTIGVKRQHTLLGGKKVRPLIAGGGYNIPMEVLRSLSDWIAVLESRGTVPGASLGSLLGCVQTFETSLATLEQVLTTPLPFVYSVHINTVWIYLFSLPFQLVDTFGWYAIPGVSIAAFIYLGFLAAGEEIEQPFGYDENDLDLDLFCKAIVHTEIEQLKHTRARNNYSPDAKNPDGLAGGIHELASLEHHV